LFATAIVALGDATVAARLTAFRQAQTEAVLAQPDPRNA
jgi:phosphoribosylcarboxyaminoimidazole (NCAIR) mutase